MLPSQVQLRVTIVEIHRLLGQTLCYVHPLEIVVIFINSFLTCSKQIAPKPDYVLKFT